MPRRLCTLTFAIAMLPVAALAQQRIEARNAGECESASRAVMQQRYDQNMQQWRSSLASDPKLFAQREQQERQFWLEGRYSRSVRSCQLWFQSGRTMPFQPN
jgi:hypothetical protein